MKFTTTYIPAQLIFILTRLSRNVLIPFFPLYLKYLNLSLIQIGFIRSFQIWTALLFSILWIKTSKRFSNNTFKQITIAGVIFTSLTICICMAFIPPYKYINNITHCVNNETSSFQFIFEEHFKKVYGALIQTSYNQSVSTTTFNAITKNNSDFEERIHTVPELKMKFMKIRNQTNKNLVNDIFKHKSKTNISSEGNVNMNIMHKPFVEFSHKIQPYSKNKKQLIPFITSPVNMHLSKKNSKQIYPERGKQPKANKLAVSLKKPESSLFTFNKKVSEGMSFSHSFQSQKKSSDRAINKNFRNSHQVLKENILGFNVNGKQTNSPSNYQEKQSPSVVSNMMKERNPPFMIDFKNVSVYDHLFPRTKIVYRKPSHDYEMIENDENYDNMEDGDNDLLLDTNIESNSRGERIPEEMESKIVTSKWRKLFRERRSDQQNVFKRKQGENKEVLKNSSINNYFSNFHKNKVSNSDKYFLLGFMSNTFLFSFILTVLYELSSSPIIPWMESICCHYTEDSSSNDCLYASLIFIPKSFLYVVIYPLLGIVTTVTFCQYQATLHCFASAILFVFTFLASLLILLLNPEIKHFRNRKPSKPPFIENMSEDSHIQRIFTSATCVAVGACMACYTENILWYVEELPGFFLNYEYLYCGYYFLYIIMLLITSRYLQDQKYSDKLNSDISDSEDENVHFSFEEVVKHKNIIYIRKQKLNMKLLLGTLLLAVILFIVPFLSRAWTILPLAFLKGATDYFIGSMVLPGFWFLLVVGYGFGCIVGTTIATVFGMKVMYFSASAVSFICCIGWLSYG